jgi:hypothetical protein
MAAMTPLWWKGMVDFWTTILGNRKLPRFPSNNVGLYQSSCLRYQSSSLCYRYL